MVKILISYLLIINLIGFFIMGYDKRKAKKHKWRVPEKSLMFIALIGGAVGALLGMNYFRHKTKHKLFTIGVPLILILQIIFFAIGSKVLSKLY